MKGVLAYLALSLFNLGFVYYGQWRYRIPMEPLHDPRRHPVARAGMGPAPGAGRRALAPRAGSPAGRRLTWLRRHPAAAAALIYALLGVVLYAPALLPGHSLSPSDYLWSAAPWDAERPADVPFLGSNFELVDAATQSQPWLEYTRERLPHVPLWDPYISMGRPHFSNGQSAVLSPFSLPAYVLPFWWSLGIVCLLKVFAAAFGTYLLGRSLGMRFGGALLAGLVFAFSPLLPRVGVVAAAERLGAAAVADPAHRPRDPQSDGAARGGPRRGGGRAVLRRPPGVELPPAGRDRRVLRVQGWPCSAEPASCRACGGRRSHLPPGWPAEPRWPRSCWCPSSSCCSARATWTCARASGRSRCRAATCSDSPSTSTGAAPRTSPSAPTSRRCARSTPARSRWRWAPRR